MMDKLCFRVQEVEGPLDLILQLIQKHKLNIYDIEISALLGQYMQAMGEMRAQNLEIASEFLDMASQLVLIKTAMLLPRREQEEDPRRELTGALLEYQACKEAAQMLAQRCEGERHVRPPVKMEMDTAYALVHPALLLLQSYFDALGRGRRRLPPPADAFSGIVARRMVPVSAQIAFVLEWLYRNARVVLDSLFEHSADRPELVATFLAVLELIKDKRARLSEDGCALSMVRQGADLEDQPVRAREEEADDESR